MSFIDPYVHVAAKLSKEFDLTAVTPEPFEKMEDKLSTRELLKDLPVSPYFEKFEKDDSLEDFIDNQKGLFPLIVKTPFQPVLKMFYLPKMTSN